MSRNSDVIIEPKDDPVLKYIVKFKRNPNYGYKLITPWTPLSELEDFLNTNSFALGVYLLVMKCLSKLT